ncbi:hypothetical protein AD006_31810 (plasmid) [Pseudonocardia sp. EC080610-09]|nr:hypothetical protein AD006_31810 [Pseudonocardia sp. EC080610-09]ALL85691.1 hypothetical protein AD017_28335 [Pseudonocardia sp. EC080619-01]
MTTPPQRGLEGTVALVTGAGRGLGRRYALDLAAAGSAVAVHARDPDRADSVVSQIRAAGGQAATVTGDARDGRPIVDAAVRALGGLDVLVVNAGAVRDRSFYRLSTDDWDDVVDVHLRGSFTACSAAWPHVRRRGGSIVLTTSGAALHGNPGQAAYSAAKAGVIGLARTLAHEGARHGVRVNAVAPMALTDMTEDVFVGQPAQRLRTEDVSPVVVALADPECAITGQVIETGGGWVSAMRWERSRGVRFVGEDGAPPCPEDIARRWCEINDFDRLPTDHPESVIDSLAAATGALPPARDGTQLKPT